MEINQGAQDKLKNLARACTKMLNAIFECMKQFIKWIEKNWNWLKTKWIELYQLHEKKQKNKKSQHHMNFSRKKITHQVIDRRPKQMIRKIIH